ncbi:MAG: glycosyltransferase family 2 protein [Pseudomonadota bacterium]
MRRPSPADAAGEPADGADDGAGSSAPPRIKAKIGVVIVNFRTPKLVIDCLKSMSNQLELNDARVIVVDNKSGDGSPEKINAFLTAEDNGAEQESWKRRVSLVRSRSNGGFSAGNNLGLSFLDAAYYVLLNSDAALRRGALAALIASAEAHPGAGVIGPRIETEAGEPQHSAFNAISPMSEFFGAVRLDVLYRLFPFARVAPDIEDAPWEPDWVSFACVLIRREAFDAAGPLDDGFFMYFEDADYCRKVRQAGWSILHDPNPRVAHLIGQSSAVQSALDGKKRPPAYYYASRTRYFRKRYGPLGPTLANLAWHAGRGISVLRRLASQEPPPICHMQGRDIWLNWRTPLGDRHAPDR